MKVNKSQALLFMYDTLIKKGRFSKDYILDNVSINSITFYRYIQELKAYLSNFNSGYELVVSRQLGMYVLIKIEEDNRFY